MRSLITTLLALLAGCGDPGHSYYPLAAGHVWQYNLSVTTMDGQRTQKLILANLGATEVNDETVYRRRSVEGYTYHFKPVADGILRLADPDGANEEPFAAEENAYDNPGTSRREPRRIHQDTYVLKLPPEIGNEWHTASETATLEMSGPPFDTMYQLDAAVDITYRIIALDETVQAPAGRFDDCMLVEGRGRTSYDAGGHLGNIEISVETRDWYAPGIGLVKSERIEKTDSTVLRAGEYRLELERHDQS